MNAPFRSAEPQVGRADALDPATLAELRDLGADEYQALVRVFRDEAATRVESLRADAERGDARALASDAHSLKGSSASFGATGLAGLCSAVETALGEGDAHGVQRLLQEVAAEHERVRAALTNELA